MTHALRIAAVLLTLAAGARAQPAEVLFVFGSDTSTPGIDVDRRSTLYHASGFALFTSPTGGAARVMADGFRDAYRDAYDDPLRLTWWMQNGSLYRTAENTNVPLGSTLSTHLMRTAHGEALARHGDEFTFHYHTWVWNDDDGDGTFFWNQARSFDDTRADFDRTLADGLLFEDMFPASFRSGWHYMDEAWQDRLDALLPFSLHNDAPHAHDDREEPIDNLYDWSRAPRDFTPFRPHPADYQRPGGMGGWNVRSVSLRGVTEAVVRQAFEAARAGQTQVPCFWGHLADDAFQGRLEAALTLVERVAADYPDVPFRYETAVGAMRRWQGRGDDTPPAVSLTPIDGGARYRITASEPLFQPVPFVALLDRYDQTRVLEAVPAGPLTWETSEPLDPALVARVATAATDSAGHVTTVTHRVLPDDVYADNRDAGFAEGSGAWATLPARDVDQAWGVDVRAATLVEGAEAAASWAVAPETAGRYAAFIRMPDLERPAAGVTARLLVDGAEVGRRSFPEAPPVDLWLHVGTADLGPAQTAVVEVRASGDGQPGALLGADAVKLTARIRDRQLHVLPRTLWLGDAVAGRETPVAVHLQNLGAEPLTLTDLSTPSGVLRPGEPLPVVLAPYEVRGVAMVLAAEATGLVRDTLTIRSDDPSAPVRREPVEVTFRGAFALVDNDGAGYAEAGDWRTSYAQAYGASSRYAFVRGGGAPEATFTLSVEEGGVYEAAYIVPRADNSAAGADYVLEVDGAERARVRVDQRAGSGDWRSLGTLDLAAGAAVTARVRVGDPDLPGDVLRADAFRLSRVGDALQAVVLDDADARAYRETGAWKTSVAQAVGPTSRYAEYGGDPRATFSTTASASGPHVVSFVVPPTVNASRAARYWVRRNGAVVDSLVVDQNAGSGAWRTLGAWPLEAGDHLEVEVGNAETSPSARVLRADAVRVQFGVATAGETGPAGRVALAVPRPNPAADGGTVAFTLPAPADATVELFDVLGRRVAVLAEGPHAAGTHAVDVDLSGLPSGVYLCRLRTAAGAVSRLWTVAR